MNSASRNATTTGDPLRDRFLGQLVFPVGGEMRKLGCGYRQAYNSASLETSSFTDNTLLEKAENVAIPNSQDNSTHQVAELYIHEWYSVIIDRKADSLKSLTRMSSAVAILAGRVVARKNKSKEEIRNCGELATCSDSKLFTRDTSHIY